MRNGTVYTSMKAAWHLDKLRVLRDGGQPVPAQMHMVISDLCNHDCSFCAYRMSGYTSNQNFGENGNNNPNRKIPTEKAVEILSDAAELGVKAVQFTGGGEPTVHPEHLRIFAHALSSGMDCALVTNGNRLVRGWDSVLPMFKWIRVSLDAGTAETYAAIRGVKPEFFDKALGNIRALRDRINLLGSDCVLGASFIVTRENFREIERAAELSHDAGACSIRYGAVFNPEGSSYYDDETMRVIHEGLVAARANWGEHIQILDMFDDRVNEMDSATGQSLCGYQYLSTYIGGDQKVYRCCNTAYNDLGEVGDLREQSFMEWFRSDKKKKAFSEFDARSCERCAFSEQNRIIRYLADPEPQHVNFV